MNNTIEYILKLRDQFSQALKGANDQLKDVEKQAEKTQSAFGSIGKAIGGIAVGAAITSIGKNVVDTLSEFEKFGAVLKNTLGSESAANMAMKQIVDFASKTPFQVDELTGSFVKLANRGFVPTMKEMENLGDLASSLGKPFDQLVEALLDAQTGEFERLKEFGIKASKAGDKITFMFKGQKTVVKNTESAIKDYVLSLGKMNGVQGAMGAISKTTGGQISNLQDKLTQLWLQIGQKLKPAISSAIDTFSKLIDVLSNLIDWISKNSAIIKGLAVAFGVYWVSNLLLAEGATLGFAGALRVLNGALLTLQANPFIAVLAGVVGGFVALKSAYDDMVQSAKDMHATAQELADAEQGALKWLREKTAELQKQKGLTESIAIDQAIKAGKSKLIQDVINTKAQFERALFTGDTENQIKYGKLYEQTLAQQKLLSSSGLLGRVKQTITEQKAGQMGDGSTALDSKIGSVVGTAPKVFNININKLVEQLKVETTTLKESAIEVEQQLTKVLINALNNAQTAID